MVVDVAMSGAWPGEVSLKRIEGRAGVFVGQGE